MSARTGREGQRIGGQLLALSLVLSQKEIDFWRKETARLGPFAVDAAAWLKQNPEVGMEEARTRNFLHRHLAVILGEENAGEIGGGVYGILRGDNPDGLTIFVRGDMDALLSPDGKPLHMCGHNVHSAWLLLNARLLVSYRQKFGSLPFKKVVFIGEPNEEGAVHPEFGPVEMFKAGLIGKTGKPDCIIAAHTAAHQPEGTVCIPHGVVHACDGRFKIRVSPPASRRALYEFIYQVGRAFRSEELDNPMGRRQLMEDPMKGTPVQIVRVTDERTLQEQRTLRPNSLVGEEVVEGSFTDHQTLKTVVSAVVMRWNAFGVKARIEEGPEGKFKIILTGPTGHVSAGGPNLKYLAAEIVCKIGGKTGELSLVGDDEAWEAVGCVRIRTRDWEKQAKWVEKIICEDIIPSVTARFDGSIELVESVVSDTTVPPNENDDELCRLAERVAELAGVERTKIGIPHLGAETFAFWGRELRIPSVFLYIGFGDREELARLLKTGEPVPPKFVHHTPEVLATLDNPKAIRDGAILALIALGIAKSQ